PGDEHDPLPAPDRDRALPRSLVRDRPARDTLDRDLDHRPVLEALTRVLRIPDSKRSDDVRVPGVARAEQGGEAVEAEPREPRPVLVPAVDQERDPGIPPDVPDASELERILRPLGLFVERGVQG